MTEEHLWPVWMHPYLPHVPGVKTQAGHHRVRLGEVIVERKVREGHVFTKRFRLVCQRCNTQWMSGIEDDVKPILIPMLQGRAITLLKNHRVRLAIWLALKVMLTESIDPFDAVISEFERDDFRLKREIPRGLQIWIGTHDSQDWYTGYWHQTLLTHLGSSPPEAERLSKFKNVQTTAIGIGHIFSLSFATTIRELKLNPNIRILRKIRRIYPLRDQPIVWPLAPLSDAQANGLADCLRELMRSPIVQWVPYRS